MKTLIGITILFTLACLTATADEFSFFESKIRPVLIETCYDCHSVESGKAKGGLRLDTREAIRKGGDTGSAVVPGDPENSLLLLAIKQVDPDLEMPPKGEPLSDQQVADFKNWIASGAADPREELTEEQTAEQEMQARRKHWSYQPVTRPQPPSVKDSQWPRSPIDRFVLAQLEENKLTPSSDAEPRVLLRRLSFALTGLPPSPEVVERFSIDELDSYVDDMLQSDAFGVRWAQHWLDVARFAESNGKESNLIYPHAWRYRDYVVNAFNDDIPYDRFLTEQIAGDLLPAESDTERARLLVATGYLALGAKGLNEMNKAQFAADIVDEQLDALTRGTLATSVACARCHDHKTDPFTMKDYYALAGIFRSTHTHYGTWIDTENNNGGDLIRLPDLPGQLIPNRSFPKKEVDKWKEQLAELDREEKESKEQAEKDRAAGKDMQANFQEMLRNALRIYWTRGRLDGHLSMVDADGNALPLCMGALEADEIVDSHFYERGEIRRPGDTVPRGLPDLFDFGAALPEDQSGRLELAGWLTHPDNPLTARVMANRIWSQLMGAGLVRTTDNFGLTGEDPSHPALLDYLAVRLQDSGWSVKALIREIVLSRTFQQSSDFRDECFHQDPDNRLLWRANKRRLDAEEIRDAMLAVSGALNPSPRPGSLVTSLTNPSVSLIAFNKKIPDDLDDTHHRSLYLPIIRESLPDVLDLFDFAEPSLVVGTRDVTNVPVQALYLLNSNFVQEQAKTLAEKAARTEDTERGRIRQAFRLCFNRDPLEEELALFETFLDDPSLANEEKDSDNLRRVTLACQAMLASAEFRIAD